MLSHVQNVFVTVGIAQIRVIKGFSRLDRLTRWAPVRSWSINPMNVGEPIVNLACADGLHSIIHNHP